ncbi:MAG: Hpt domain-containing protein [Myxococcales bacterium]|nr:Hpt domain-containing protein [Myxococcales bacterium]
MDAGRRADFVDRTRALLDAYRGGLPGKVKAIEAELHQSARDGDSWRRAARLAHQLAGSAGSFGHAAVGDAATALELLLLSPEPDARPSPALLGALAALRAAVDRALEGA